MSTHGLVDIINQTFSRFEEQRSNAIDKLRSNAASAAASLMESRGGWIFLNDPFHTLSRSKAYLMGLNPGGADSEAAGGPAESSEWWITQRQRIGHPYSCFVDEPWKGSYQGRVRELLRHLGEGDSEDSRIRSTFATNLSFFRTPSTKQFRGYPAELVDCWEYHREFLGLVQPELVICIGNSDRFSAYSQFKVHAADDGWATTELGNRPIPGGKSDVKGFILQPNWPNRPNGVLVVGIPHLSYPVSMPWLLGSVDDITADSKSRTP